MNTAVTECARCTGKGGAHFAFCFLAQAWDRLMGPGFPWAPEPARYTPKTARLSCVHDIPLDDPCIDCLPEPAAETPYEPDWDEVDWLLDQDRPDPDGVMEDFLVMAGHLPSDADWLPADRPPISVDARTELPDGYLDEKIGAQKPARNYDVSGLEEARRQRLQAQEDAAVQFVYDVCEFVPGGRVRLDTLYERYIQWQVDNNRPSMAKPKLRVLLAELGLAIEPGRLPEDRTSGRAPLLVHGVALRPQPTDVPTPQKVVVRTKQAQRTKHALIGAKPGRELPKQVRELIEPLLTEQGWAYEPSNGNGRGKPRLIAPDGKKVTLPTTPHLQGRTLENTRSFIKSAGGQL